MSAPAAVAAAAPDKPRASAAAAALRVLLHLGFLLIALGALAAYEHFSVEGRSGISYAFLAAAAGFGFAPLRDVARVLFAIEGKALHLLHALGALALVGLPLAGFVSGGPVLTHAALAPFAIMGAAQALMHQEHPRNARQAAAMRRFAQSLPELARFSSAKDLASPAKAKRAVAVLTDIVARAQALGQTELDSDPGFQSALRRVSTRFGANLGLDAVELALGKLAANPATAGAVPALRRQLASARKTLANRDRK